MGQASDRSSTAAAIAVTAIAPALFGTTYLTATSDLLPQDRPLLLAALRATPAAIVLLLIARPRMPRTLALRVGAVGLLNCGAFFCFLFAATNVLPTGIAATVTNTAPLFVLALAPLVLSERPEAARLLGGALAVLGVALLVGADAGGLDPLGLAFGFAAALSMALGLVSTRRWLQDVRPLDSAALQLAAGAALAIPLAVFVEGGPVTVDAGLIEGTAYLSLVITAAPYVLLFRGVQLIGPARVALLGPITPVIATILGVAVLGETFAALQVVGLVVVVVALVIAQVGLPGPRRPRAGPTPAEG